MKYEDMHQRAGRLMLERRIEPLSAADDAWMESHLVACPRCAGRAGDAERVIGALRSIPVALDPALLAATRLRVRRRADELQTRAVPTLLVWAACLLSCGWIISTTPYVWRSLEWIAGYLRIPRLIWQMGFGLWWLLPALALAALLSELRSSRGDLEEAAPAIDASERD